MLRRAKTTVGLDIGSSAVKVVEIEQRGGSARLVNFGVVDLLPEAIVEGEVMDRQLVCEAIQNLFESREIKHRQVATGVSGRGVIVKRINMERLSLQDARQAIHWEAEQHVPYDINDVSLDFELLKKDVGPNQMQVLLVAAKRDLISAHADLVREAGLIPTVIDVNTFAVQNAAEHNYELAEGEIVALVNVGAELTNVNLVQNGIPLYTQDLSMGGDTILDSLQKRHQLSRADVLAILRRKDEPITIDLVPVITSFCGDLGGALERSLVYLRSNGDTDRLDRVLLSGGGARLPDLAPALSDRLKIPVEVVDPLRRIDYAPEAFGSATLTDLAPQLTVGIGLALRRMRSS